MASKQVKRLFALLLAITMVMSNLPDVVLTVAAASTEFAGGNGTESDPYLIETKEHLNNVRNDLDAHYKMIADIVFTDADFAEGGDFYNNGFGWAPIATNGLSFRGVFDGNNHIIKRLSITIASSLDKDSHYGLFGEIHKSKIQNLTMTETSISVNNNHYTYIGCIVGYALESNINNCTATGSITATNYRDGCTLYAGGIVGSATTTSVVGAESRVNITTKGYSRIGGICGHLSNGSVSKAINHGALSGTYVSGGIAGDVYNSTVENCTNYGTLNYALPLVTSGVYYLCAGIVGSAHGNTHISLCSNYGDVSTGSVQYGFAAGIVADMIADRNDNFTISKCYNTGNISANSLKSYAGGIAATYYYSSIIDCFNVGKINSVSTAGGIVSFVQGVTFTNCYNIGDVSAAYAGGIVGENSIYESLNLINCVYKDNVDNACGKTNLALTPFTAEKMQKISSFTNWDFENTWEFAEGNAYLYPTLKNNEYYLINKDAEFQGGQGSEESPYLIASVNQLDNIRKHLGAHFKLVRNIVFSADDFAQNGNFYNNGQGWQPIGSDKDNAFCGVFDGNNFTIENITINYTYAKQNVSGSNRIYETYVGLFGYNKGKLLNLNITNANFNIQLNSIRNNVVWGYIGMICAINEGTIMNCNVSGRAHATENYVTEQSIYTQVYSYVGGISGKNAGIIRGCSSKATLIGCSSGGIVGDENRIGAKIDSCYNLGPVSGSDYTSGICGGVNYGEITNCYNAGVIDGSRFVSGIVTSNGARVNNSFNCGNLMGGSFVGGIASHWNTGSIDRCYNVGEINSTDYFGGIIFPSENSESGTVTNSYYLDNIPEEVGSGRKKGKRCSYEEMQNKDCFVDFDFSTDSNSVWTMSGNADYPFPELQAVELTYNKELQYIAVYKTPNQITYLEGKEDLDVTGGQILLIYNCGVREIADMTIDLVSGFDNSVVGKQTVTVSYLGHITEFEIEIEKHFTPGDIDGNEAVTQDDAVYLLLYTMFGEAFYPLDGAVADIDGNGSVTQDDAVYLLLHTMFGETFYPLNTPALPAKENAISV